MGHYAGDYSHNRLSFHKCAANNGSEKDGYNDALSLLRKIMIIA